MAEGDLIVRMLSQGEAKVYDDVMKLAAAWSNTEEATGKAGQAARKTAKEQSDWASKAASVIDSLQTPMDRYNKKIGELGALHGKNLLSLEQYNQAATKATSELQRQEGGLGKVAVAHGHAFGSHALQEITGLVTGYMSVHAALELINKSLEHKREIEAGAKEAVLDEATAQREALIQLGPVTDEQRKKAVEGVEEIAKKQGVGGARAWRVFHQATTMAGGKPEVALGATQAGLGLFPGNEGQAATIAKGLARFSDRSGMTPAQGLGFAQKIGQAAEKSLDDTITTILPAIEQGISHGFTPYQAGAAVASVSRGSSGVRAKALISKMADLPEKLAVEMPEKDVFKEGKPRGVGLEKTDWQGRIALLRAMSPEKRDEALLTGGITGHELSFVRKIIGAGEGANLPAHLPDRLAGLGKKLATMMPEKDTIEKAGWGETTPQGRVDALRKASKEKQDAVIKQFDLSGPTSAAIRQYLTGGDAAKAAEDTLKTLPAREKLPEITAGVMKGAEAATPGQATVDTNRRIEAVKERLKTGPAGQEEAWAGTFSVKALDEVLKASGATYSETLLAKVAGTASELTSDKRFEMAEETVKQRIHALTTRMEFGMDFDTLGIEPKFRRREVPETDRRKLDRAKVLEEELLIPIRKERDAFLQRGAKAEPAGPGANWPQAQVPAMVAPGESGLRPPLTAGLSLEQSARDLKEATEGMNSAAGRLENVTKQPPSMASPEIDK